MSQIISFINMKGGVAKTTLCCNVGYALAHQHGKRVLIVDADPQFNASTYLMTEKEYLKHTESKDKRTLLDVFVPRKHDSISTVKGVKKAAKKGAVTLESLTHPVMESGAARLHLVPSTLALMELETSQRGTENRLANFLEEKKEAYDYILIDCPPTISIFSQAAILASEKYIVPLKPDPLSTTGLPLLEKWLQETTESAGIEISPVGIVFCMVRNPLPNTMDKVMRELRKQRGDEVFDAHLSQSTDVATSVEMHKPIFIYKPDCKCATEITDITDEFIDRTE